ncbi:MAG: Cation transport ATPase [Verrucomicrobiales bacterium]|nr:Cation transport ATPase [Verrucomicrobiales bacterium]
METVLQPGAPRFSEEETGPTPRTHCFHCETPCATTAFRKEEKSFCCHGCLTVFEILTENGLTDFYKLSANAGVRVKVSEQADEFAFLDEPTVRQRLVNFSDDRTSRITLHLPAIHCIACVWLLEHLFRLKEGIGQSVVNFPRKEISISFENEKLKLSEVVALLASLGYEPDLKFSDLEKLKHPVSRRLWLQLGIAGFAFGNIMLFSISSYFGLDVEHFKKLFGYLSFALALPVFFYSASDYWKSAWQSLRRRMLTIEVPIAAGIVALFAQSAYEVCSGRGEGYFDSLAGLLFFLLCGKLFQQKTYDRLAFDRDYKSFFPLSVTRKTAESEERVSLSQLEVGNYLLIRHGELIPADARVTQGVALIDYSFVTGESEPVEKQPGDHLFAGGRQIGAAIEVETVKAVSQSYLTSLWSQESFRKEKSETLDTLTNVYSQRFTKIVMVIAIGAALFWWFFDSSRAVKAFTSVLIVACPCALALAAPFALGTAQRVLARRNIFLKTPSVIETLAKVDAIVFDKTGTLTAAGAGSIAFAGAPLTPTEENALVSLSRQSTHPNSARIAELLSHRTAEPVRSFVENTGCGIEGLVGGTEILMGSALWLQTRGVNVPAISASGSTVHIATNQIYRGCFILASAVRAEIGAMLNKLSEHYELTLLSGDNEREREQFSALFGTSSQLYFNHGPQRKFEFVGDLQSAGKTVMMVGDGLNDAGAFKQSAVGVAVVENISAFSPASDVIMSASMVPHLHETLRFSKGAVRIVKLSFLVSSLYNVIGLSIAASGKLSPIICAILMPLSSITVVAFACGMTAWLGKRTFGSSSQVETPVRPKGNQSLLTSAATTMREAA